MYLKRYNFKINIICNLDVDILKIKFSFERNFEFDYVYKK